MASAPPAGADSIPLALARRIAKAAIRRCFGSPPKRFMPLGGGLSNAVFAFDAADETFVLRLHTDAAKLQVFEKERWAIGLAAQAGVPVAPVLLTELTPEGAAIMVARRVEGTEATHHPDRLRILEAMGDALRRIHGIATAAYGMPLCGDGPQVGGHGTWGDFLEIDLEAGRRIDRLRRLGAIDDAAARRASEVLSSLSRLRRGPCLHHGDMRLKNVVVDEGGAIRAVIDWDNCVSAHPPYWDLAIALHDLGVDGKQALLRGYGVTPREASDMAPILRTLNLLHYAPVLDQLLAAGDREALAWCKARLSGALDLHGG